MKYLHKKLVISDSINPSVFLLLLAGLLNINSSCANLKKTFSHKGIFEIHFGRSGGFSNVPMEYRIKNNGDIIKIQNKECHKINSISRRKIKTIKDLLIDTDFEHLKIYETGNITYFITVKSDRYENTVKWNDLIINDLLKGLYKELLTTTKP